MFGFALCIVKPALFDGLLLFEWVALFLDAWRRERLHVLLWVALGRIAANG